MCAILALLCRREGAPLPSNDAAGHISRPAPFLTQLSLANPATHCCPILLQAVRARPVPSSPMTSLREQHTEARPSTPAAPAFPAATDALLASAAAPAFPAATDALLASAGSGPAAPAQPAHPEEPAANEFASPVLAPIAVHASEDADAPITPSRSSQAGAGLVPGSVSCLLSALTDLSSSAPLFMSCHRAGGPACKGLVSGMPCLPAYLT